MTNLNVRKKVQSFIPFALILLTFTLDLCPGIENPGFVLPNMTIPKAKRATLSDEDFEITNF